MLTVDSQRLPDTTYPCAGHDDLRRASVPNPAGFQRDAIMNHQQAKPATVAQPMAPEKARRKQKIDGMEFYEWAELIRSSSL